MPPAPRSATNRIETFFMTSYPGDRRPRMISPVQFRSLDHRQRQRACRLHVLPPAREVPFRYSNVEYQIVRELNAHSAIALTALFAIFEAIREDEAEVLVLTRSEERRVGKEWR